MSLKLSNYRQNKKTCYKSIFKDREDFELLNEDRPWIYLLFIYSSIFIMFCPDVLYVKLICEYYKKVI